MNLVTFSIPHVVGKSNMVASTEEVHMWIPDVPRVSKFELMLSEALFQYLRHTQIKVESTVVTPRWQSNSRVCRILCIAGKVISGRKRTTQF